MRAKWRRISPNGVFPLNDSTRSVPFSTTADTALVNNAVNIALANRSRSGATILHADHRTQFTSWSFGENMRRWDLLSSFGTIGDRRPPIRSLNSHNHGFKRRGQIRWTQ
jgi:hypothetical protein